MDIFNLSIAVFELLHQMGDIGDKPAIFRSHDKASGGPEIAG